MGGFGGVGFDFYFVLQLLDPPVELLDQILGQTRPLYQIVFDIFMQL